MINPKIIEVIQHSLHRVIVCHDYPIKNLRNFSCINGSGFSGTIEKTNNLSFFINGKLHRSDGPAVITNKFHFYYIYGNLHRQQAPAIVGDNVKAWYRYGKLHREDGPAIEKNNIKLWFFRGKLHRIDGPAIEMNNKRCRYFYKGIEYDKDDWLNIIEENKLCDQCKD